MAQNEQLSRRLRQTSQAAWAWTFGRVPLDQMSENLERRQILPERAPGPRRAANAAYQTASTFVVADVAAPQPAGRGHVDSRPRPPRRAARSAYAILNGVPGPDLQSSESRLIPDRAPGYRRAPNNAYLLGHVGITPPLIDIPEDVLRRTIIPDRAPGYRRAARPAYHIANPVPPADVAPSEVEYHRRLMPDRAPGPRRAPSRAYLIATPPAEPQFPAARGFIDSRPRPYRRATPWAYHFHYDIQVPDVIPGPCCVRFTASQRTTEFSSEQRTTGFIAEQRTTTFIADCSS